MPSSESMCIPDGELLLGVQRCNGSPTKISCASSVVLSLKAGIFDGLAGRLGMLSVLSLFLIFLQMLLRCFGSNTVADKQAFEKFWIQDAAFAMAKNLQHSFHRHPSSRIEGNLLLVPGFDYSGAQSSMGSLVLSLQLRKYTKFTRQGNVRSCRRSCVNLVLHQRQFWGHWCWQHITCSGKFENKYDLQQRLRILSWAVLKTCKEMLPSKPLVLVRIQSFAKPCTSL